MMQVLAAVVGKMVALAALAVVAVDVGNGHVAVCAAYEATWAGFGTIDMSRLGCC